MPKLYTYLNKHYTDKGLYAFSRNDNDELYIYYFVSEKFRKGVGIGEKDFIIHDIKTSGTSTAVKGARMMLSEARRRKNMNEYFDFIFEKNILGNIMELQMENRTGFLIKQLIEVRRKNSKIFIRFAYANELGTIKHKCMWIDSTISDYEDLYQYLLHYKEKTEHMCAHCSSLMIKGRCVNCGSLDEDTKFRDKYEKFRKLEVICYVLGILSAIFVFSGIIPLEIGAMIGGFVASCVIFSIGFLMRYFYYDEKVGL